MDNFRARSAHNGIIAVKHVKHSIAYLMNPPRCVGLSFKQPVGFVPLDSNRRTGRGKTLSRENAAAVRTKRWSP